MRGLLSVCLSELCELPPGKRKRTRAQRNSLRLHVSMLRKPQDVHKDAGLEGRNSEQAGILLQIDP